MTSTHIMASTESSGINYVLSGQIVHSRRTQCLHSLYSTVQGQDCLDVPGYELI